MIADDDVFTDVATAAYFAIGANPCGAFDDRTGFDDGARADEDGVADERFADGGSENGGF